MKFAYKYAQMHTLGGSAVPGTPQECVWWPRVYHGLVPIRVHPLCAEGDMSNAHVHPVCVEWRVVSLVTWLIVCWVNEPAPIRGKY